MGIQSAKDCMPGNGPSLQDGGDCLSLDNNSLQAASGVAPGSSSSSTTGTVAASSSLAPSAVSSASSSIQASNSNPNIAPTQLPSQERPAPGPSPLGSSLAIKADPDGMSLPPSTPNAPSGPSSAPATPLAPSPQHPMSAGSAHHRGSSPQHNMPPQHPGHQPPPSMMQPPNLHAQLQAQQPPTGCPNGTAGPHPPTKGALSMDSQYMQQQSQIFVFSTQLANQAAEAVTNGHFQSVIAYHCSQPGTQQFLETHPLKTQQFNRQNHAAWLSTMAGKPGAKGLKGMPPNMSPNMNRFGGPTPPQQFPPFKGKAQMQGAPCNPNGPNGPGPPQAGNFFDGPWPPQNNFAHGPGGMNPRFSNPMGGPRSGAPGPNSAILPPFSGPNSFPNASSMNSNFPPNTGCNTMNMMPMQTGTRIPDEELTPQQRQHREESLAKIRKLGQTLLGPELADGSPHPQQGNNTPGPGMMRMPGPNQHLDHFGPPGQNPSQGPPPGSLMPDELDPNQMMGMGMGPGGPNMQGGPPPGSHQEWVKMQQHQQQQQQQFFERENRRRGMGGPANSPSSGHMVPNSPRMAGPPPPPPYHQGPRPSSSPHPASPAMNSMSLPSPRMQSPADASRQMGSHRLPPYSSPGPGTPSQDSNMSLNHGHSPKPQCPSSQALNTSGADGNGPPNGPRSRNATPSNSSKKDNNHPDMGCKLEPGQSNKSAHSSHNNSCSSPVMCKNEPQVGQLMPVPSPQHIQYLNAFEGQELTIQKQPNTSLRDSDLIPSPDLDLNFGNDFPPSSFPSHGPPNENGMRFGNPMMDHGMRYHGPGPNQMPPNGGQFEMQGMGPRFMPPDMHRMPFDNRMPGPMENGNGPRPGFGPPHGMDGNMMRFPPGHPGNQEHFMQHNPRMRGPPPGNMQMGNRFPGPPGGPGMMNDPSMQPQFGMGGMMPPMDQHHPNNSGFGPSPLPPTSSSNPNTPEGVSSTHLQSLQKMTPPFDIGPPSGKLDNMGNPMLGGPPHGHGPGPPGHMQQQQQMGPGPNQRGPFDPIASMAAMTEHSPNSGMNPNMMPPGMNMTAMQVGGNGPGGGPPGPGQQNMVNFHTQMSSMHSIHQNQMNSGPNPNGNPGMHGPNGPQFGMNQGPPNMVGGAQTVNNTYVNANLQIQQLNVQNMPPNFNPNMPPNSQGMCMPNQMGNNMHPNQMMPHPSMSPKLGQNPGGGPPGMGGPRMSSPSPQNCPFPGQPGGPGPRGMPMNNFQMGNNGMPGGGRGGPGFNSPNIQVKPDAPNTIQYLPNRGANPTPRSKNPPAPNLDFLQHTIPLTNLDKKVPSQNLQYFPNSGGNMPPSNGPNMNPGPPPGNMPMNVGPGRPQLMMRGPQGPQNHMGQMGPGGPHNHMMQSGDMMYNRPPGPQNMGPGGPGMYGPGPPGGMNGPPGGMNAGNGGPPPNMHMDGGPPQMGPNYNHFKQQGPPQQQNYMNPNMGPDPNYDRQYLNFQQQLYATNSRGNPGGENGSCANNQVHNNIGGAPNFYGQSK